VRELKILELELLYRLDWRIVPDSPSPALPEGRAEIYTSCLDIELLQGIQLHFLKYIDGQDLNSASIKSQVDN
jgi:hypothetical protein